MTNPWPGVLDEECAKPYFGELLATVDAERAAGTVIYPRTDEAFAAFGLTSYADVRVVILGQDPYPQPRHANGLAFSVAREITKLPASMKSIHAALRHDGIDPPPHGDLTEWAERGVLLLNTALTVRDGDAGSHSVLWRRFTDVVIETLSARPEPIVFVLWGREAEKKRRLIDEDVHDVVTAPHPASRGASRVAFQTAGTFSAVNAVLTDRKEPAIDWTLRP